MKVIVWGDDRGDDDDNKRGDKILNDSITILNEIKKKQIFQIMCRFIVIVLLIVMMGKG